MGLFTEEEAPWFQQLGNIIKTSGRTQALVHPERKSGDRVGDVPQETRQWEAFEFAEQMEQGLAPGLTSSFVAPLEGPTAAEGRLRVQRSVNMKEYLLTTQSSEPLLLAVRDSLGERFDIYIARPGKPMTALGPAFLLQSRNTSLKRWTLQSVRCECCESRGRRSCGVGELARMSHYVEPVGEGQALCMDLEVPAPLVAEPGRSAVWCSVCNGQQGEDESSIVELSTRRPKWSPKHRTLSLNFNGRCSLASSKNFQLEARNYGPTPGDVKLLFGKISNGSFVLDYKRPLGMVQAFAAALTASHWK